MSVVHARPDVAYATRQNGGELGPGQWMHFKFLHRRADQKIDDHVLGPDMVYKVAWQSDEEKEYPEKMSEDERSVIHCDVHL